MSIVFIDVLFDRNVPAKKMNIDYLPGITFMVR